MLFGDHGVDPQFAVAGNRRHDGLQDFAFEALGCEDLPDFLALPLGHDVDFACLGAPDAVQIFAPRAMRLEVADAHAEAVGEQVGEAEYDRDRRRQAGADDPGDDREGRHATVDAAEHRVRHGFRAGRALQAQADQLGAVPAPDLGFAVACQVSLVRTGGSSSGGDYSQ